MTEDQIAQLGYLTLLVVAIGGYFLLENRYRLGRVLRQASLWGLIFIGAIAAAALWTDIRSTVAPKQAVFADTGRVEVPRNIDGHYYMVLELDGVPVRFVVDTGATDVVLSEEDATRVGLDPEGLIYSGKARTANGIVRTARVRIGEFRLGEIVDENVPVWVTEGEMEGSLLGMSYLQRFAKIEIAQNELVLQR